MTCIHVQLGDLLLMSYPHRRKVWIFLPEKRGKHKIRLLFSRTNRTTKLSSDLNFCDHEFINRGSLSLKTLSVRPRYVLTSEEPRHDRKWLQLLLLLWCKGHRCHSNMGHFCEAPRFYQLVYRRSNITQFPQNQETCTMVPLITVWQQHGNCAFLPGRRRNYGNHR